MAIVGSVKTGRDQKKVPLANFKGKIAIAPQKPVTGLELSIVSFGANDHRIGLGIKRDDNLFHEVYEVANFSEREIAEIEYQKILDELNKEKYRITLYEESPKKAKISFE